MGYSTAQFGKCHEVPVWESGPLGPFDHWPHPGGGFEYFYGFIGGETNQWYPALRLGNQEVEPDRSPDEGYHFMADMTDKAIAWVRQQKALGGQDKPFFAYFAPGATHTPTTCPKSGPTSTRATSTRAGTGCGRRPPPAKSSSASSPPTAT
jgi:arylsulfatase A-like enzyme